MLRLRADGNRRLQVVRRPHRACFPRGSRRSSGRTAAASRTSATPSTGCSASRAPRCCAARRWQDVIFNGSEARKPAGHGARSRCTCGGPTGTRRPRPRGRARAGVFRDGESEYLLNGAALPAQGHPGPAARGAASAPRPTPRSSRARIDQILNAKPKDRRAHHRGSGRGLGLQAQARLAELKLEATQANLLRVQDIISEVQRQIGVLKRQAARARRYGRLRDELRAKERMRFALARAARLDAELARRRARRRAARDREAAAAAQLAGLEADTRGRAPGARGREPAGVLQRARERAAPHRAARSTRKSACARAASACRGSGGGRARLAAEVALGLAAPLRPSSPRRERVRRDTRASCAGRPRGCAWPRPAGRPLDAAERALATPREDDRRRRAARCSRR